MTPKGLKWVPSLQAWVESWSWGHAWHLLLLWYKLLLLANAPRSKKINFKGLHRSRHEAGAKVSPQIIHYQSGKLMVRKWDQSEFTLTGNTMAHNWAGSLGDPSLRASCSNYPASSICQWPGVQAVCILGSRESHLTTWSAATMTTA